MNLLNVSAIKSWWLRFLVLIAIGIPALSGWPLAEITKVLTSVMPFEVRQAGEISSVAAWFFYSCIVWLIVYSSVGLKKFLEFSAASFIIGLTTAILGSVMRKGFPFLAGALTANEISLKMVNLLLVIVTVTPYLMLFVNSFSAKNIIAHLSDSKGKKKTLGLHFALLLRVIQHTGEVIFNLMEIWSEEHPDKVIPRHRRDWVSKWYSSVSFFPWVWSAVVAWIYATMIHTFEPIPGMVDEVERIDQHRSV